MFFFLSLIFKTLHYIFCAVNENFLQCEKGIKSPGLSM